jgi:glycosyltransferase involved in cell wall biosynthesis
MKILQLCSKLPFPEKDGGAIAVGVFTKALLKTGNKVKMLAMNTSKHFVDNNSIPKEFAETIGLETVYVDISVKPIAALTHLLRRKSYNVSRFYSDKFEHKLSEILQKETFDIIQLEGLYVTPYIKTIRKHSDAPVILREHNIEWFIWERLAKEEKNLIKRKYINALTKQLKAYEKDLLKRCDGITTFTITDMQHLRDMGCKIPIAHIPFGIDIPNYRPAPAKEQSSLFYIGALDWRPNIQGLEWLLQKVWPKINGAFPQLKFHIAGRNMPEKYKTTQIAGIVFHGEVESALNFMNDYSIMVIPLLAGSGVRVKIIEAMALQKPIITTGIGIEGIECNYENDIMIANTPEEFFNATKQLVENSAFAGQIALNARCYIETNHDIDKITNHLLVFYKDIISTKKLIN